MDVSVIGLKWIMRNCFLVECPVWGRYESDYQLEIVSGLGIRSWVHSLSSKTPSVVDIYRSCVRCLSPTSSDVCRFWCIYKIFSRGKQTIIKANSCLIPSRRYEFIGIFESSPSYNAMLRLPSFLPSFLLFSFLLSFLPSGFVF